MSLVPRIALGGLDLTEYPFALEFGADVGSPENVYEVLSSLLADGEVVGSSRTSNRQMILTVLVEGADMLALAEAEASLLAECDKQRNTLSLSPGDGYGPTTVFDTFRAQVVHVRSDEHEMANLRRYVLTIQALPYGRSVDKVTDDAEAADIASGTVIDDGTSTPGWSGDGSPAPTVAVESGAVKIRQGYRYFGTLIDSTPFTGFRNIDTRAGLAVATGAGGYLSVVIRQDYPMGTGGEANATGESTNSRVASITYTTSGGATVSASFAAVEQLPNARVRYAWPVEGGLTVTSITVTSYQYAYDIQPGLDAFVYYDDLIFSTGTTTSNQYVKVVDVAGSARAPGSIHVAATVALGSVMLLSMPEDEIAPGFTPDVTRWKTAGSARSVDATVIGGGYLADTQTFEIPVTLLTEGAYTVVMLNKPTTNPMSATVTASLVIDGVVVGKAQTISNSEPLVGVSLDPRFFTVGELYLPTVPVQNPDSTAKVRLVVSGATFAEMWLCPSWGDLTLADCGTGTVSASGASSHLWVDSPSAERPMGSWWRGASADRAKAVSAVSSLAQPGRHLLYPARTRLFVASSAAQGPTATVDYYPRHWGAATQ